MIKWGLTSLGYQEKGKHRIALDDHSSTAYSPVTPEDHYRAIYLEALDTVTSCISERFEQEGYQMYKNLEQLLLKGDQGEEADALFALYSDDFDRDELQAQLHTFHTNYKKEEDTVIAGVIEILKSLSAAEKALLSEVVKVARTLLVSPASNAVSERSFSAMHRIKTYLRSTMLQERLNAVMLLHMHQELTDSLDLKSIANEFHVRSDYRKAKLRKF